VHIIKSSSQIITLKLLFKETKNKSNAKTKGGVKAKAETKEIQKYKIKKIRN